MEGRILCQIYESSFHNKLVEVTLKLPIILQQQASECGIACLAMVSQYWSLNVTLNELREKFQASIAGLTLADLVSYSEHLGFSARAIKVETDNNKNFNVPNHPLILHWEMDHFVVLKRKTRKGFVIHDPSIGEILVSNSIFFKKFTGIALDLRPMADFKLQRKKNINPLKSIVNRISYSSLRLPQILIFSLLIEVLYYTIPFGTQKLMARVDSGIGITPEIIFSLSALLTSILVIIFSLSEIRNKILVNAAAQVGYYGSINILAKLLRLPMSYFETRFVGDIASRVNTIEIIRNTINPITLVTFVEGLSSIFLLLYMLKLNLILTSIIVMPISLFALYRHHNQATMASAKNERTLIYSQMNGQLYQNIRGISSIKLNSLSSIRSTVWNSHVYKSESLLSRSNIYIYRISNIISTLEKMDMGIVILIGVLLVSSAYINMAELMTIITIRVLLTRRVLNFINLLYDLKLLDVYIARLLDITETQDEDNFKSLVTFEAQSSTLDLYMSKVSYRYGQNLPYVVKNLDLYVKAGEVVAITAPSGVGKSTILKLICGLAQPEHGNIISNKQEINRNNILSFRSKIGVVMQDDQIFSGTLLENITSFNLEYDEELVDEVIQIACLDKFIDNLPMKLNTLITDLGGSLSGGQRQRLMLARALYRRPLMLLLDEATSHLDLDTERSIIKNLRDLGITIIHVAHRQQTIELADRVIHL